MRATSNFGLDIEKKILVNTNELQALLSCGRSGAVKVGMEAGARVDIGTRVLWNRKKVEKYLNIISI